MELWKDIPGYEGRYQVSNLGRVKSLPRLVDNHTGQLLVKERILNINATDWHDGRLMVLKRWKRKLSE